MPRYDFECKTCDVVLTKHCSMHDIPTSVACDFCGREAKRVFSVPQLVTQPELCSDANKKGLAEMNAKAKVEDAAYGKRWDRRLQAL
jgi:putative FmdB family regulatory protein